jgi:peptidoglycan/xylan/chitin deacetylase (PgdA/CDA1 family)
VAYLTFDDGPSPVTRQVLDILKQHQVKATFFVVGKNIPGNEALLKRAAAEGHVIGGHTYSHDYRIIYKDIPSFFRDLEKGNKLIEQVIGTKPAVFRFPGGSTNTVSKKYQDPLIYGKHETVMEAIKAEAKKRGYTFIDWNVDNGDARSSYYTAESAVANVKQQAKNQREIVILMHDSAPKEATAKSLPAIIQHLKAEGYRFDVITKTTPTVAMVK